MYINDIAKNKGIEMNTKQIEQKARDLFEMTPQPPKTKPVKKDPYKYDNTYPCHDFEPFETRKEQKISDTV